MNTKPLSYCVFCDKKTKVLGTEHYYCVNGHKVVLSDGDTKEILPKSVGTNISSVTIFRKGSRYGPICNRAGIVSDDGYSTVISQIRRKDESKRL